MSHRGEIMLKQRSASITGGKLGREKVRDFIDMPRIYIEHAYSVLCIICTFKYMYSKLLMHFKLHLRVFLFLKVSNIFHYGHFVILTIYRSPFSTFPKKPFYIYF